jgi:hypothetical protein
MAIADRDVEMRQVEYDELIAGIARLRELVDHWHRMHDAEFELRHKDGVQSKKHKPTGA